MSSIFALAIQFGGSRVLFCEGSEERDEMRREGACEVGGKRDATWEASRQPSVFMLTRRAAVFAAMRPTLLFNPAEQNDVLSRGV